ncbi:Uncharacterized protein APZ42_023426 [Daphnia magna]|uniref:Uncharacterized protein n=1 Tax=Daphnia magna TaxID=35525 RepID=A0A164UYS6_9CRUS|nr:Uncharacterized protein APZ42_023426 [Daphnia magna]
MFLQSKQTHTTYVCSIRYFYLENERGRREQSRLIRLLLLVQCLSIDRYNRLTI